MLYCDIAKCQDNIARTWNSANDISMERVHSSPDGSLVVRSTVTKGWFKFLQTLEDVATPIFHSKLTN